MTKAIGTAGLPRITPDADKVTKLLFPATTSTVKQTGLKRGHYSLLFSVAGATDISYQVTRDSMEAVAAGNAKWTTAVALTNQALGDYYIGDLFGVTGVRATVVKNGSATDDAAKTTLLGARAQIRVVPIAEVNRNNIAAGTDYTGTFGDNPDEPDA